MKLGHLRVEALSHRRYERDLERAGGDDDLVGLVAPVVELDAGTRQSGLRIERTRLASSTGRSK